MSEAFAVNLSKSEFKHLDTLAFDDSPHYKQTNSLPNLRGGYLPLTESDVF